MLTRFRIIITPPEREADLYYSICALKLHLKTFPERKKDRMQNYYNKNKTVRIRIRECVTSIHIKTEYPKDMSKSKFFRGITLC